jgi:hypothetical protein
LALVEELPTHYDLVINTDLLRIERAGGHDRRSRYGVTISR